MVSFGSLFTGVGGFDLGFERAGLTCSFQVEIDRFCNRVLAKHWPLISRWRDVRDFPPDFGDWSADVICAGFPCQDLSVAGKRAGLKGERSGLFYELIRVVRQLQPYFVVIENVPALLSSNDGRDFAIVLSELEQCGAIDICWRVLDSQYFGVPQRRRRVFVVADFAGCRAGEILFEPACVCRNIEASEKEREKDSRVVAPCLNSGGHDGGFRTKPGNHIVIARQDPIVSDVGRPIDTKGNSQSVCFEQNQRNEVRIMDIPGSLKANPGMKNQSYLIPGPRRFTPTECLRLQGFPDDWCKDQSDTQIYKQTGNAVTVNVAEWIGRRVIASSDGESE